MTNECPYKLPPATLAMIREADEIFAEMHGHLRVIAAPPYSIRRAGGSWQAVSRLRFWFARLGEGDAKRRTL